MLRAKMKRFSRRVVHVVCTEEKRRERLERLTIETKKNLGIGQSFMGVKQKHYVRI